MTTSPQFKQAILNNLERINGLQLQMEPRGTLYAIYLKDYSKRGYLSKVKTRGLFKSLFLQKVF